MDRISALDLVALVLDEGTYESWDQPIDVSGYSPDYRAAVEKAAQRSGCDESIITGRGLVRGRPVSFVLNEFGFLAGSIGRAAAQRIVSAVRRATAEGLPLLASTASGGTRMQEGTPAFVHMVDISRAIMDHRAAGLPYLVHLRHPTTGGVFASWGSLGHITVAEPGALVGFLGPKVYELLEGRPFPSGVQVSENLARRGIVDSVVLHEELPSVVDRALGLLVDPVTDATRTRRPGVEPGTPRRHGTWESIEITRAEPRVGARDVLRHGSDATVRLQGTEEGERDTAMLVAFARLDGVPCVVVGQDRTTQTPANPMGPAALREARRGMRLAAELGLPLVSLIDTPGAELSPGAEEGAIAGEIARCIAAMSTLEVPSVSVLLGQGSGGGALALLPADVVVATENAWLSPLPPEGASAIVHGDVDHAPQMAQQQRVSALDLQETGTVHHVVPEPEDDSPEALARAVAAEVGHQLRGLLDARGANGLPSTHA